MLEPFGHCLSAGERGVEADEVWTAPLDVMAWSSCSNSDRGAKSLETKAKFSF